MKLAHKQYVMLYMTNSQNIVLNVGNQGLSFAIDKRLDNELGTDVTLGLNEWKSVFDLIKKDQVSSNESHFGEKDTDITNGKCFVVQKDENYEIKHNVWQQIVDIAKKTMGITDTVEQEPTSVKGTPDSRATNSPSQTQEQTPEEIVRGILANNIEVSEERLQEIVKKYNTIVQYLKDNNTDVNNEDVKKGIQERILNYAKGLQFHDQETKFADSWAQNQESNEKIENASVAEAMANGDMESFKAAFHQMAKEYIETYDNAAGDGKIDFEELIAMEEKELGHELTDNEKEIIKAEALKRITLLDQNDDGKLDSDEIAAYLWAMSKINDGQTGKSANDITFSEWKTTQESLGILSLGDDRTQEDMDKYALFSQTLKNGYEGLKK